MVANGSRNCFRLDVQLMAELFLQLMGETIIYGEKIWGGIKCLSTLSLSLLKKRIAVVKEKASAMARICSRKAKVKHRISFLSLKFTVFFFDISKKGFEKAGKALKTAPFVSFRAKP